MRLKSPGGSREQLRQKMRWAQPCGGTGWHPRKRDGASWWRRAFASPAACGTPVPPPPLRTPSTAAFLPAFSSRCARNPTLKTLSPQSFSVTSSQLAKLDMTLEMLLSIC